MFNLIDVGERAGSGIPNIYNVWKKQGWSTPKISESFDPERITLSLLTAESSDKKVAIKSSDKKVPGKSTVQKEIVIDFLTENVLAKCSDIANLLGVKEARARRLLAEMISEETVVAEGGNRNRTYKLKS